MDRLGEESRAMLNGKKNIAWRIRRSPRRGMLLSSFAAFLSQAKRHVKFK
jgi:hypothetical protein